jgi:outer membrane protein insertion porin family
MGAARAGLLPLLLLGLLPAPVRAQIDAFIGLPVVSVTIVIGGEPADEPGLLELIDTRVGAPLAPLEVRASIGRLFGLGRFDDIQVEAVPAGDGVALRYHVVPVRRVVRIEFRGDRPLASSTLRRVLRERYGPAPALARAEEAARVLEQYHRDRGYLQARVSATSEPVAPGRAALVFDIAAGLPARIGRVDVEGAAPLSREALLQRFRLPPGGRYNRADLERRLARYADALRAEGYYEAVVGHAVQTHDDGAVVDVTLEVHAGPRVTLVFRGDRLPADVRDDLVPIQREGTVDEDLLEDSNRRIVTWLREHGYWRAQASHSRTPENGGMQIVFDIRRGRQYRVAAIEVSGNAVVSLRDLQPLFSLQTGEPFVEARLDADLVAIGDFYRRRGFTDATVRTDVVEAEPAASRSPASPGTSQVVVRLAIEEGVQTTVGNVMLEGHAALTDAELRALLESAPGRPYYVPRVAADRNLLQLEYFNRGFQDATVDVRSDFDESRMRVRLTFGIHEGPQTIVNRILIVGNDRTAGRTIERELLLRPGEPLGLADLVESHRRLAALGLFRRVRISDLPAGGAGGARRDVLVTVEEAPATAIGYGAGLEGNERLRPGGAEGGEAVTRFELAPRGFFEVARRNLWGSNRSVNLFTRASLRPRTAGAESEGGFRLSEYRVVATYREPKAFGLDADFLTSAFFEQAIRSSFSFKRRGINAEASRRVTPAVRLSGRYAYLRTELFDERFRPEERLLIDRAFPQLRLSMLSPALMRDTRDDPLDPAIGALMTVEGHLAVRAIASQVGFGRTLMQGFFYRPVHGRRVVLAGGVRLGLATGFPRGLVRTDETGDPVIGPDGQPIVDVVREIPASERFFAGGHTTVRGFTFDLLGQPETIDQSGFPKGGNGLIVLNTEVRFPVWRHLGGAAFLDAGNVFARVEDLDLSALRGGTGFGLRYRTPIGPLRFDVGVNLSPRELPPGRRESRVIYHVSIGHAF